MTQTVDPEHVVCSSKYSPQATLQIFGLLPFVALVYYSSEPFIYLVIHCRNNTPLMNMPSV